MDIIKLTVAGIFSLSFSIANASIAVDTGVGIGKYILKKESLIVKIIETEIKVLKSEKYYPKLLQHIKKRTDNARLSEFILYRAHKKTNTDINSIIVPDEELGIENKSGQELCVIPYDPNTLYAFPVIDKLSDDELDVLEKAFEVVSPLYKELSIAIDERLRPDLDGGLIGGYGFKRGMSEISLGCIAKADSMSSYFYTHLWINKSPANEFLSSREKFVLKKNKLINHLESEGVSARQADYLTKVVSFMRSQNFYVPKLYNGKKITREYDLVLEAISNYKENISEDFSNLQEIQPEKDSGDDLSIDDLDL